MSKSSQSGTNFLVISVVTESVSLFIRVLGRVDDKGHFAPMTERNTSHKRNTT